MRYFLVLFFFISSKLSAQSVKLYEEKAIDYESNAQFYAASKIYEQALEKFPDNIDFRYRFAETLRKYNNYEDAAKAYKNVITDDKEKKYKDATYWYAIMLKQQGKYDLALKQLELSKSRTRKNDDLMNKIDMQIASCKWALANNNELPIVITHLDKAVNTPNSEFNPFMSPDGSLLFSSLRLESKANKPAFTKLYSIDSANFSLPDLSANFPNKHITNGHITTAGDVFYFNVCDNDAKKKCAIFFTEFIDDKWSDPLEVEGVNNKEYNTTQPFLARMKDEDYLLFASDRYGTKGGLDLWKAKRVSNGKFEYPENVEIVNTMDEEMSPSYLSDSNLLYFSSEGHYGYGGLDMFKIHLDPPTTKPINLGLPINSPANDLGHHISPDLSTSYFVSNRKGSFFIKAQTCCYDIWSYPNGVKKELPKKDSAIVLKPETIVELKDVVPNLDFKTEINEVKKSNPEVSIKRLIPVVLYFHNDEPDPRSVNDTTSRTYAQTFQEYTILRNGYIKEFSLVEKNNAAKEINDLFVNKVDKGFYDLISFSAYLRDILKAGKSVKITLKGYCSPLNYNAYNISLGNRRTVSVFNHFSTYRNGELEPYIKSGQLSFDFVSLGEENAPTNISENRLDKPNSVYHPVAAMERKTEIIAIEIE
jgi:tetratricopeptide (TPR) repeat protein